MKCYSGEVYLVILLCINFPGFSTEEASHFNSTSVRELLISSYEESLHVVQEALHSGQRQSTPSSSTNVFTFIRETDPETQEISRAAEVFQTSLQVLGERTRHKRDVPAQEWYSSENLELLAHLSQNIHPTIPNACEPLNKYRTISGQCNNRYNPSWGAANIPLARWLPAEYEDGRSEPKGWNRGRLYNGFQLPPVQKVSQKTVKTRCKYKDHVYSRLLVEWGQYVDHDISFTPQSTGTSAFWTGEDCSATCENKHPCYPIQTEDSETGAIGCMPFRRSKPACFVNSGFDNKQAMQRQQINGISSFLDASQVYGNTPQLQSFLRDLSGLNGKLSVNDKFKDHKSRAFLPFVANVPSPCHSEEFQVDCFSAGDSRSNEGLPLTSVHTLSLREHNRVAETLANMNGHWSPETVFQETRKIIGAQHQIITFRDYLPKILGREAFENFIGPYQGYNPATDPSCANVFSTAAFRFGHATIAAIVMRLNESFQEDELFPNMRLRDTFFSPWRIVIEGGIDPIIRGLIGTEALANTADKLVTAEVTNNLVVLEHPGQMDLPALNMQRGRDHGLPGYNDWRSFCGLKRIQTLDELIQVVSDARVAKKILNTYRNLDNIDVWLGGLAENRLPGARNGPLFACLIGKQMKALRDGDRFWWDAEGIFTEIQKAELLKVSMSRIICDNTDIEEVLPDSFRFRKYPSGFVSCDHIPSINLEAWREAKGRAFEECGPPRHIENGNYILTSVDGQLIALYSCYHGFKLTGTTSIVCEGHRWNDHPPQCTETPRREKEKNAAG